MEEMEMANKQIDRDCPACGIKPLTGITDEHLMSEYLEMRKAESDRMFGHNAQVARKQVAAKLIARGITEIPNIFGPIAIRV